MDGYRASFERAGEAAGFSKEQMIVAEPWPTEEHFVELLATRIKKSLNELKQLVCVCPLEKFVTFNFFRLLLLTVASILPNHANAKC